MDNRIKELINILIKNNKTISTMESCTGGGLANIITNVEGSSEIFKFSAITYSNEYKIKMGVNKEIIDKYSVYSMETACEMSKNISVFANSNYGVGITGKLNRIDKNNLYSKDNVVYISIYDRDNNRCYNKEVEVLKKDRKDNKDIVINEVINILLEIVK